MSVSLKAALLACAVMLSVPMSTAVYEFESDIGKIEPSEESGKVAVTIPYGTLMILSDESSRAVDLNTGAISALHSAPQSETWITGSFNPSTWSLVNRTGIQYRKRFAGLTATDTGITPDYLFASNGHQYSLYSRESKDTILSREATKGLVRFGFVDNESESLITGSTKGVVENVSLSDSLNWRRTYGNNFVDPKQGPRNTLVQSRNFVEALNHEGETVWSRSSVSSDYREGRVALLKDDGSVRVLDSADGEVMWSRSVGSGYEYVRFSPGGEVYVQGDGAVAAVSRGGVEKKSLGFAPTSGPNFVDWDSDSGEEMVMAAGNQLKVVEPPETVPSASLSGSEVLVGDSDRVLRAVSLGFNVHVSESAPENLRGVDAEPVALDTAGDMGAAVNFSGTKWYAEERRKRVLLAALASLNRSAALTLDRSEADRSFEEVSYGELRRRLVEELSVNHVVVGDLDSRMGLLAASVAAERRALPVDVEYRRGIEKAAVAADAWNQGSGAGRVDRRIEEAFEFIGQNPSRSLSQYVSLLGVPRYAHSVELEDYERDRVYWGDQIYGNLDEDRTVEASVGRYPEDVSLASKLFLRGLKAEKGKDATVASIYGTPNWVATAGSIGGYIRKGSETELILDGMGYNVTHLVEYRAEPERYFTGLTLTELDRKYGAISNLRSKVKKKFGGKASRHLGQVFSAVLGIREGVELSEILMEYRWRDFEWNTEDLVEEALDTQPRLENPGAAVQKATAGALVESQMPPRHPNLNRSTIAKHLESSDAFYFYGFGNRSAWELKEEDVSIPERTLGGVYGEKSFRSRHLPENVSGYVLDTSDRGALSDADLRERMLESGARNYVGFSSVAEPVSASVMWNEFATDGLTVGEAARAGVNLARTGGLLYSREPDTYSSLMVDSLTVFGDPEATKDPIDSGIGQVDKECSNGRCEVEITFDPNNTFVETADAKLLDLGNASRLSAPGQPTIPVYRKNLDLHPETELESRDISTDYRQVEDLVLPESRQVGRNESLLPDEDGGFPTSEARIEDRHGETVAVVAGATSEQNTSSVLESATLTASYTSPITLELASRNSAATIEIYSDEQRTGTLLYQNSSRSVELQEGSNTFEIADLNATETVEARLITESAHLHADTRLSSEQPIEVTGFDPQASETTQVSASAPGKEQCIQLKSEIEGAAALEIGEQQHRTLCPADESVTWSVTGMWDGNASFEVNGTRKTASVESAPRHSTVLEPVRVVERALSTTSSVEWNGSGATQHMTWRSSGTVLRHTETPMERRTVLETPRFRAVREISGQRTVTRVVTPSGEWRKKSVRGRTSFSGTMERPEDLLVRLDREVSKARRLLEERRRYRKTTAEAY